MMKQDKNLNDLLSQISIEVSEEDVAKAQKSVSELKEEEHIRMQYRMFAASPK